MNGSPLGLDCYSKETVEQKLRWQEQGGFDRSEYVICTRDGDEFVPVDGGERIKLRQGVFTDEAWDEFVKRGY